jgi:hypothetical protein
LRSRVYGTTRASNTASSAELHVGHRNSVGEIRSNYTIIFWYFPT